MADDGHGEKLTRKMEQAIAALLTESTIGAAAKRAGIGEATLGRWLKDETFSAAYRSARQAAVSAVIGRLARTIGTAVDTFEAVMNDTQAPASARVAAAAKVIDLAYRGEAIENIRHDLAAVQALVAEVTAARAETADEGADDRDSEAAAFVS